MASAQGVKGRSVVAVHAGREETHEAWRVDQLQLGADDWR